MAASRINKLLYSANSHRFAEGAATSYMSLEADRLKEERVKEERGSLDGVDNGKEMQAGALLITSLANRLNRSRRALPLRGIASPTPLFLLQPRSST